MAVALITTKLIPRQVWMFGLRCKQGLMIIRGASSARDIRKVQGVRSSIRLLNHESRFPLPIE